MNFLRPLLAIPSPRDIIEVRKHIDRLPIDTLWVKYYNQEQAYEIIRNYFLTQTHNEYTHLIICPDDLIVKPSDLKRLLSTVSKYDYPVCSGTCTISSKEEDMALLDMTLETPTMEISTRKYNWMSEDSPEVKRGEPFEVGFNGLALCCIRRDVVERLPFQNIHNCCNDLRFAIDCHSIGIKLMVDPKIRMLHLKKSDTEYEEFMVGKKAPHVYLLSQPSELT